MKREDIRKRIEGITDEQLDWLMTENGRDIEKYKSQVTTLLYYGQKMPYGITKKHTDDSNI